MRVVRWQSGLHRRERGLPETTWLRESGSLTTRCQRCCRHFEVQVLSQSLQAQGVGRRGRVPVREVILRCDGQAVIFARSTLSTARSGRLGRWFARLGKRSLGSLLFRHPGFSRGAMAYARIRRGDPLHRRIELALGVCPGDVWARRSNYRFEGIGLELIEVFLPAIRRLG